MGFTWQTPPSEALVELVDAYETAVHTAVKQLALRYVPEIEAWMKTNAPWTDRTGNARQTLTAEVEELVNQMVTINFGHGVEYGIHLELNYGGQYAIVGPALDYFAPKIWADVQGLF